MQRFNKDVCVYYKYTNVSARVGHQRFTAAGETDCPQRKAWRTDESTRRTMHKQLTTGSRNQLPTYKWINRRF
jgi:hypothetical protein